MSPGPRRDWGAAVVVGDLADLSQTRALAQQVNAAGRMDAVIHNAGVMEGKPPASGAHPRVLVVNVLAPFLLTALIQRPDRLVYLSSGMHRSGDPGLPDATGQLCSTDAPDPQRRLPTTPTCRTSSSPS